MLLVKSIFYNILKKQQYQFSILGIKNEECRKLMKNIQLLRKVIATIGLSKNFHVTLKSLVTMPGIAIENKF